MSLRVFRNILGTAVAAGILAAPSVAAADPVSILTAAVAAGLSGAAGVTVFGLGVLASSALIFAANLALGFVSQALAPKPKPPNLGSFEVRAQGRTQQIRQPVSYRRVVYGEQRVSGPLVFVSTTSNNANLHLVIALAGHEVAEIGEIYLDGTPLGPLDGDGLATERFLRQSGTTPTVRVKKHLGTADQAADDDLVSEVSEWTTDHRLRGIAYIYVRLRFNSGVYKQVPQVSAVVRGKKVTDTRDGATKWTPNPALIARDYLTDTAYGLGAETDEIDDTFVTAAANTCEEFVTVTQVDETVDSVDAGNDQLVLAGDKTKLVTGDRVQVSTTDTLPGGLSAATDYYVVVDRQKKYASSSVVHQTQRVRIRLASSYANALARSVIDITDGGAGTHTVEKHAEPRYACDGVIETNRRHLDVLDEIRASMAGRIVHAGDTWRISAGAYDSPTLTFDENDVIAPLAVQTKHPGRDRFNAVKGVFVAPLNDDQPSDYPPVTNATYETEDGGRRTFHELDLPWTRRPHMAQRLAKIELERHRQQISVQATFGLSALRFQAGDVIMLDQTRMGWSGKAFEVASWRMTTVGSEDAPALAVEATLRETASTVFDWSSGEETAVDPAPDTTLPDALNVVAPTGLTLTSGTDELFVKQDGTVVSRIKVAWTDSVDAFADRVEIQFKKSSASAWQPSLYVPQGVQQAYIWDVEDGAAYDVQVRAVNTIGRPSDWVETSHTVVGKSEPPENVVGFSAQQNGNVVVMRWQQVGDADLAGYEIRYIAA